MSLFQIPESLLGGQVPQAWAHSNLSVSFVLSIRFKARHLIPISKVLRRGGNHSRGPRVRASVCTAQDALAFLCCQDLLLACAQLAIYEHLQILISKAAPKLVRSQPVSPQGLFLPCCSTWHLFVLNFIRFLLANSSSLSGSFRMAILPSSIWIGPPVWFHLQTWWECTPFISSRLLIKMLNRTGPRRDSCGTPLIAGVQVEYNSLTTTLFARSSNQVFYPSGFHPSGS